MKQDCLGYDSLEDYGYIFFWSGKSTVKKRREAGAGFAVRKEIAAMLDEEPLPINDRIMTMRLPLQRKMYATFISVCAPNADQYKGGEERILQCFT